MTSDSPEDMFRAEKARSQSERGSTHAQLLAEAKAAFDKLMADGQAARKSGRPRKNPLPPILAAIVAVPLVAKTPVAKAAPKKAAPKKVAKKPAAKKSAAHAGSARKPAAKQARKGAARNSSTRKPAKRAKRR